MAAVWSKIRTSGRDDERGCCLASQPSGHGNLGIGPDEPPMTGARVLRRQWVASGVPLSVDVRLGLVEGVSGPPGRGGSEAPRHQA
jgi:hypothetical protein